MEAALIFFVGWLFGIFIGSIHGRRSIVKEAQALVAETIIEIRDRYETKRNDRQAVH
jgi:hypothetical protein